MIKKIINKKQNKLLSCFIRLRIKIENEMPLNYFDKKLIEILEEYDFLIDYEKDFLRRNFNE